MHTDSDEGERSQSTNPSLSSAPARQEDLHEQGRILVQLARSDALVSGNLVAAFREIAAAAAHLLAVRRVGIWFFDDSRSFIRCVELYDADHSHSWGTELSAQSHPLYFACLDDARAVPFDDVSNDPRTADLRDGYLRPLGISSMLDVPIRSNGTVVGIICHEHAGKARQWSTSEQLLASSFGDIAALALETAERQHAVEVLQRSEANFRSLIENTSDLMLLTNADGTIRFASPSHERILGFKAADLVGTRALDQCHPDDREKFLSTAQRALARPGEAIACELRLRTVDGSWRVFDVLTRNLLSDPIVAGFVVNGHDVTDRKRVEEEKDALLEISRDVTGTLDLQQLFDRVLAKTVAILGCDVAVMFRREDQAFRAVASHGFPPQVVRGLKPEFRVGPSVDQAAEWEPVAVINDIGNTRLSFAGACTFLGVSSLMLARVRVRDRLTGALAVGHRTPGGKFSTRQIPLLEGISRHLGIAMQAAELYEAQKDTAAVAEALARVGQVMISSLDTPVLLEGLCQVSAQVLGCDFSHTLLVRPDSDLLELVSTFGDSPEQKLAQKNFQMANASRSTLVEELRHHAIVERSLPRMRGVPMADLGSSIGVTNVLCIGLWRGPDLVGVQTAGYRGRDLSFKERDWQIARGIGQLASLGLANARLVEELALADRRKSEFVATVSHELRTPINVVVGYIDMMLDSNQARPELESDILQRVRQNALALHELITSTLDFSRVESGRDGIDVSDTEIDTLVAEVVRDAQRTHGKPGVAIHCGGLEPRPRLRTDRSKLKVIAANLVSNALKFTDSGRIQIEVRQIDDTIEIAVTDTGAGIPSEAQQAIFDPFHQVADARGTHHGGFGLGLYIVRRLIEQIKGTIDVDSEIGRGSTFRVRVPPLDAA